MAATTYKVTFGTLRPERTTTPLPTEENPLLRFYPLEEEEEEITLDQASRMEMKDEFYVAAASTGRVSVGKKVTMGLPLLLLTLFCQNNKVQL